MFRLLSYLISLGVVTGKTICPPLEPHARGLPDLLPEANCHGSDCDRCTSVCPTGALEVQDGQSGGAVSLDLGKCIGCSLCISECPTGTIVPNLSTRTSVDRRDLLVLRNQSQSQALPQEDVVQKPAVPPAFKRSFSVRVVSTGCSACDLEVGAAFNSIFDAERFGISIVASPRMADAILVTGPVPRGMHEALLRTYEAMPEPRRVIAVGSCAISGGVHGESYSESNGVERILPVDVFVPGCPPHPWSIIHGIFKAMGNPIPD